MQILQSIRTIRITFSPLVNYNLGPGRAEENLADLVDICLNKIIKIAL